MSIDVDDMCAFLGELENGTPVVFNTSSVAWVPSVQLQIDLFGSEGAITFQEEKTGAQKTVLRVAFLQCGRMTVRPASSQFRHVL